MKQKLKEFLSCNNRLFKIKLFITFILILGMSSIVGQDSQNNVQDVAVFSNVIDAHSADKDGYVNQGNSKTENNGELIDGLKLEATEYGEFAATQEEIKLPKKEARNTFAVGSEFTVKGEEAYTFGRAEGKKYVFLTFDDGPSANITPRVLETLKKEGVKATFFLLGNSVRQNPKMVKRELEEGHAVANHTYEHNYDKIYPGRKAINVEVFSSELERNQQEVDNATENQINMRVVRFPGGSFESWKNPMKKEITDRGMCYIDWNVENGDGLKANISVEEQLNNIRNQISGAEKVNKNVIILMHDAPAKKTTADALPQIIEYIKSKGYEFATLK